MHLLLVSAWVRAATCPDGQVADGAGRCLPAPRVETTTVGYRLLRLELPPTRVGSLDDEEGREDDEPSRVVQPPRFYLGESEVTQGQWAEVLRRDPAPDPLLPAEPWVRNRAGLSLVGSELPVQGVNWCQALRFANALSRVEGRAPVYGVPSRCEQGQPVVVREDQERPGYRLPTAEEWEAAARLDGPLPWGRTHRPEDLCDWANLRDQAIAALGWEPDLACDDQVPGLARPGTLGRSNPLGFVDLIGNVREWTFDKCADVRKGHEEETDGAGRLRVERGGGWTTGARWARLANLSCSRREAYAVDLGLRLARTSTTRG